MAVEIDSVGYANYVPIGNLPQMEEGVIGEAKRG
jgi:hypothetical protein